MAMGSGAFLVQTCRYLSEKLVEAWENAEHALNGNGSHAQAADHTGGSALARQTRRGTAARRYRRAPGPGAPPGQRALPVRRGQKPHGRRNGQTLALADHPRQKPPLHLPGSRPARWRLPLRRQRAPAPQLVDWTPNPAKSRRCLDPRRHGTCPGNRPQTAPPNQPASPTTIYAISRQGTLTQRGRRSHGRSQTRSRSC